MSDIYGDYVLLLPSIYQLSISRGLEYETVITERAAHAYKIIQTVDPNQYSGVVTVSGDGLVHEVSLHVFGLTITRGWSLHETCP
jgi:diacylglycerol kinase family enzyme